MRAATFAMLLIAATPALAQDRPPALQPTRDVAVSYRAGNQNVRMSWQAAEGRMRMDMPGQGGAMIVDTRGQSALMLMEPQRMAMRMAFDPATLPVNPMAPSADTRFTREGTATVAGLTCTNWRMTNPNGTGTGCITTDGVLLRGTGSTARGQETIEATEVRYGAQDAALFRAPEGYRVMDMGNLGALGGALGQLGGQLPGAGGAMRPPTK
ncbi:DUF4412 domain-containing protein [Humitalea sp. 24SJ18S-53]|uniref:DUF4412 domain-containing protein n=1 Tax=Humitalea sp. 24SJ18S-53 TaxID=3422307 RepID=UPI003D669677